jgi:hypothetical protein
MAIVFSNNKSLSEQSGMISAQGRVIQVVETTSGSGVATSSTSPVDIFSSASITLTNPNNFILIELHSNNRANDWGDGVWNLYQMDIIHNNTGAQLTYTGHRGELTNSIRHITRSVMHQPGNVGPHSYKCRGWSYQASSTTFVTGADGTVAYLRLTEIAA